MKHHRIIVALICLVSVGVPVIAGDEPEIVFDWGRPDVTQPLAYERARAYPLRSADVLEAFLAFAAERKIVLTDKDTKRGIFTSRWIPIDEKRFPGLQKPDNFLPVRVRYRVFIPQGVEPARVYLGSELEARQRKKQGKKLFYNAGGMEHWLFQGLEELLGETGRELPADPAARWKLFDSLIPGASGDCAQEKLVLAGLHGATNPVLIERFKVDPTPSRNGPRNGRVILQAVIYEDGSVDIPRVVRSDPGIEDFATIAKHTTSFWRYEPAMRDGCPVATEFTIVVEYQIN